MLWLRTWWRHQMEAFSALLALCAGNSPVTGEFPAQGQWRGALMFSLICTWIYKRLSKQSRSWWFETPSRPLWRHCNESTDFPYPTSADTWRSIITSLLRQNDVATSFWRNNDVIATLCVHWDRGATLEPRQYRLLVKEPWSIWVHSLHNIHQHKIAKNKTIHNTTINEMYFSMVMGVLVGNLSSAKMLYM